MPSLSILICYTQEQPQRLESTLRPPGLKAVACIRPELRPRGSGLTPSTSLRAGSGRRIFTPPSKVGLGAAERVNKPPDTQIRLISEGSGKYSPKFPPRQNPLRSKTEGPPTPALVEWKKAHADLFAEIKIRDYSPKTLKSYGLWARKLQGFNQNKAPHSLSPADVKGFRISATIRILSGQRGNPIYLSSFPGRKLRRF